MLLSFAPTCLWEVEPLEFIRAAIEAEFDGIGLRLSPSPHRTSYPVLGDRLLIADMKVAIARAGLQVLDVFTFYIRPEMDWNTVRDTLALSVEFGARFLNVNGIDPDWSRMRDSFGQFCQMAAEFGLIPLIEFAPVHQIPTLDVALRLIDEVRTANAGIALDAIHFFRGGGKPEDLRGIDPKLLPVLQLTDGIFGAGEPLTHFGPEVGGGQRRLPGQGEFPLSELLEMFPSNVALCAEVLPRPAETSSADWAKAVAKSTRQFLLAACSNGPPGELDGVE